jgi:cytochrome c2
MKHLLLLTSLMLAPSLVIAAPYPEGDSEKGAKVFRKCVSCHMVGDGAKNRVGPQLNNIIGREIASLEGYRYSKGMKAYAEAQNVWSEENMDAYLANPRKAVKGTRMAFAGLRKEKDRHNVIAYLKAASQ